ncbi:MAG: AMP-binding protein [Myxococcota bacterium]
MTSVAALWRRRARSTPQRTAFRARHGERWASMSWAEADARVRHVAAGLLARGIPRGARVAILCGTRVEWILADFGVLCAGAATSTIYPSSTAQTAYILRDADCWAVVVEDAAQLAKVREGGVVPEHVFAVEEGTDAPSLRDLEAEGAAWLDAHPDAVDERIDALGPDDLATLIYTSGTTGPPKGVVLTHDNWCFQAESVHETVGHDVRDDDLQYLFLPLAHSFGKICELVAVELGVATAVDGDLEGILAGLQHERPTLMPAVPRVFEKIHHRIHAEAARGGPRRLAVLRWAVQVGAERVRREQAGERVGLRLRGQTALADRLVYRRLRAALGGRIRAFVSGGAPLTPDIAGFFQAAGMTVVEGYGLTETSAGAVANRQDDVRFGTVGRTPSPGSSPGSRRRRGAAARPQRDARLEPAPTPPPTPSTPTAGCTPATSARSTPTGGSSSPGASRTSSSPPAARTSPRRIAEQQLKALSARGRGGDGGRPASVLRRAGVARPGGRADLARRPGQPADVDFAALSRTAALHDAVWAAVEAVNATLPSYATIKRIALVGDAPMTEASGLLTPSRR